MAAFILWLATSPHCPACLGTGLCPHCLGTRIDTRDRTGKCIWGAMWLPRSKDARICWCRECKGHGQVATNGIAPKAKRPKTASPEASSIRPS